jgi:hypothetical protein
MSDYTEHARLSPSGSKGWFACPGKITMEAPIPEVHKTHADAGTAMHWVAAWCLTEHYDAPKRIGEQIYVNNEGEPQRTIEFTEEMADLVQGYVNTIRVLSIGQGKELFIEKRVDFSAFVGVPEQFGTLDCGIVNEKEGELFVIDLKTGHTPVDVVANSQLQIYGLGLINLLWQEDLATEAKTPFSYAEERGINTIRLGIYQPKLRDGMVEWACTLKELQEFADKLYKKAQMVEAAAKDYLKWEKVRWEKAYLNPRPNEVECAFCKALPTCPAAAKALEDVVGADFEEIVEAGELSDPAKSSDAVLGIRMAAAGFLEDWIKAIRAEVERRLLAGGQVPGFGLELGRKPPRKWGDPAAVEETLRHKFKCSYDEVYNMKLKSPTQIEAACDLKKNEKPPLGPRQWKAVQAMIVQGEPSPSVKPISVIKTPYVAPTPDASAFTEVPAVEDCDLV